ncbi:hypothetical protein BSFA1_81310 (plasmid) [Burkholderia sp. SFA1]|nr:hypothetical protein BYI23_E002230 [Burkholderia sp. YI23]BBQ03003.1 hypothetical protein BSFA1_81310 [Burkholderia sp. SFA1]
MGLEAYRVRASRLAKHLYENFGLSLSASERLIAIAAEEGIPRANWNVLAARAADEPPVANQSELVAGAAGSGKSVYAKRRLVEAVAAQRPVLVISPFNEYQQLVKSLGGRECVVSPDGEVTMSKGISNICLLTWDGFAAKTPRIAASCKELGFQKPDLREIFLVADEVQLYAHELWFLKMLSELDGHECATVTLVTQDAQMAVVPAIAAKVETLRLFRHHDFAARRQYGDLMADQMRGLSTGQSLAKRIKFLPAASGRDPSERGGSEVVMPVLQDSMAQVVMNIMGEIETALGQSERVRTDFDEAN